MEREREGDDAFGGILDPFWHALNKLDNVGRVKRDADNRCAKVRKKKSIQACGRFTR
jgi:hypothetical protein